MCPSPVANFGVFGCIVIQLQDAAADIEVKATTETTVTTTSTATATTDNKRLTDANNHLHRRLQGVYRRKCISANFLSTCVSFFLLVTKALLKDEMSFLFFSAEKLITFCTSRPPSPTNVGLRRTCSSAVPVASSLEHNPKIRSILI